MTDSADNAGSDPLQRTAAGSYHDPIVVRDFGMIVFGERAYVWARKPGEKGATKVYRSYADYCWD